MDEYLLQDRLCYSAMVAGKAATVTDMAHQRLRAAVYAITGPPPRFFDAFARLGSPEAVEKVLREARTGNYKRLSNGFYQLATSGIDLATCTPEDLERFPGIGRKTSRFFILWTRPNAQYAALDVHILRWLGQRGYPVPNRTPTTAARYNTLERAFVAEAALRGVTPRELDWDIWSKSANYTGQVQSKN